MSAARPAGALICLTLAAGLAGCDLPGGRRPGIILVVIDTARADRFAPRGDGEAVAARFGLLAPEGTLFRNARSVSSWTVPAHASLFTGLFPASHLATQEATWLDERFETLAEILDGSGYLSVSFSGNPWVSGGTNMVQGFDEVFEMWSAVRPATGDGLPHPINLAVSRWLGGRDSGRPFFLFINYIEPHWPYEAPASWLLRSIGPHPPGEALERGNFSTVDWYLEPEAVPAGDVDLRRALYDAEIAYADAVLGDLRSRLEEQGAWEESLVIVTSDHGENLGDHGHMGHSFVLYDSTLRVPLVIKAPGGQGRGETRDDPVQLTDLFTTILAAAGAEPRDPRIEGVDLLEARVPADRPVLAEYYFPSQFLTYFPEGPESERALRPFRRRIRSLQSGDDKLIWGSDGRHELYDLGEDPGEHVNLIDEAPDRAGALEARLHGIIERIASRPGPAPPQPILDDETREKLRSLGYIQ